MVKEYASAHYVFNTSTRAITITIDWGHQWHTESCFHYVKINSYYQLNVTITRAHTLSARAMKNDLETGTISDFNFQYPDGVSIL